MFKHGVVTLISNIINAKNISTDYYFYFIVMKGQFIKKTTILNVYEPNKKAMYKMNYKYVQTSIIII